MDQLIILLKGSAVLGALFCVGAYVYGYVLRPNVDSLVEAMDMREAQRAYEANLNVIETARAMEQRTLDLLKR